MWEGIRRETREKALKEGRKTGIEEGRKQGMEQGIKKGIEKGVYKVAKGMLKKNISIETISECTGLTIEQIKEIAKS